MTPSSFVDSHEADIHEEDIWNTLVDEEISHLHIPLFSIQSSNSNLEGNKLVFLDPVHTSLDDGALFYRCDVLEARSNFVMVGCAVTLTVAFLPMYSFMLTVSIQSISTEYGRHNHALGVDYTLF